MQTLLAAYASIYTVMTFNIDAGTLNSTAKVFFEQSHLRAYFVMPAFKYCPTPRVVGAMRVIDAAQLLISQSPGAQVTSRNGVTVNLGGRDFFRKKILACPKPHDDVVPEPARPYITLPRADWR